MSYQIALMIRADVAKTIPVPDTLLNIIGQPTQPDPENPEEVIPVTGLDVFTYFNDYRDQLNPVESAMPTVDTEDVTVMFSDGATEPYMFPIIMSDRIPGTTEQMKQQNREAVKAVFDGLTTAGGTSWVARYLTAPELRAYANKITDQI